MKEFRTIVDPGKGAFGISHSDRLFMTGSCFVESIGGRLATAGFDVACNPMGTMYNPASVASCLRSLASGRRFAEGDLASNDGLWFSFDHHGSFSGADRAAVLGGINRAASEGAGALREAAIVVVTFGTAWIFERQGSVVANCHKLPAREFTRRRMSTREIVEMYDGLFENILAGKKVIFTLSPIRHLGDGAVENSLSKAILRVAIAEIVERHPAACYFPSFEIMTDDLRDYRFWAEDMVHPSPTAVDYIWEAFAGAYFDERTRSFARRAEELNRAAAHRPLHPDNEAASKFREDIERKTAALRAEAPGIKLPLR